MRYETEPEWDYIFVGVSTDGQEFSGEWWSGDSEGWQYFDLDLSDYIGYPEVKSPQLLGTLRLVRVRIYGLVSLHPA